MIRNAFTGEPRDQRLDRQPTEQAAERPLPTPIHPGGKTSAGEPVQQPAGGPAGPKLTR